MLSLLLTAKTSRHLMIIALAMWLAGVGCFVGYCEPKVLAAAASHHSDTDRSAPFNSQHSSCHVPQNGGASSTSVASTDSPQPLPSPPHTASCCPLAGLRTEAARKLLLADEDAVTQAYHDALFAQQTETLALAADKRPYIPDRGGTYLRCCVFLI